MKNAVTIGAVHTKANIRYINFIKSIKAFSLLLDEQKNGRLFL